MGDGPGPMGARIRERRQEIGLRQAELAQMVGISPSYLNLIEHGRRRIGGKLLLDLARVLRTDPALLAEVADPARLQALRAAAASGEEAGLRPAPEASRVREMAERFPGWAGLVLHQAQRIDALGLRVTELAARLSHDRDLAAALHRVLSGVTSIRAASGILADDPDLDRDWRDRFLANIRGDSEALAEASRALMRYLEAPERSVPAALSPPDEAELWLDARDHLLPEIETGEPVAGPLPEGPAGEALRRWLALCAEDAAALPLGPFGQAALEEEHDPVRLARRTGRPLVQVMRRLVALPPTGGHPRFALAIADASGTLLHRRRIEGFALPREAACPFWPLFEALAQPGRPVRALAEMPEAEGARFLCHAVAEYRMPAAPDETPCLETVMVACPAPGTPPATAAVPLRPVGPGCRLCLRERCPGRREPSILR
ncbi:XRE family transcriptional regulator [Rubellimicrobium sp. CFH 75288]|uniref:XRE family transcriptional regulator n=1 Tax=Rubellimicrobium sp. CFH 75288 TaxID=2697034 RepID=UPI001FB59E52|nr:XRE family transcriptional regulator [Rubellimicrobium sp. CFH 75288]